MGERLNSVCGKHLPSFLPLAQRRVSCHKSPNSLPNEKGNSVHGGTVRYLNFYGEDTKRPYIL